MSTSRQSTYGSSRQSTLAGSSQPDSALAEMCVAGTINCIETLEDSLIDLDEQNRELKRIGDAIKYNRVYVLVPEKTVREYSIQQSSEIEPQITEMLQLAEKSIKNLERKETILKSRLEAQKSRANSGPGATEILNEAEERRKRLLARQRHTFEKEMVSLQREIEELQQQLDARDS